MSDKEYTLPEGYYLDVLPYVDGYAVLLLLESRELGDDLLAEEKVASVEDMARATQSLVEAAESHADAQQSVEDCLNGAKAWLEQNVSGYGSLTDK